MGTNGDGSFDGRLRGRGIDTTDAREGRTEVAKEVSHGAVRCGEEGCGVDGRRERDGRRAEVRKSAGGIKGSRRDELSMIRNTIRL